MSLPEKRTELKECVWIQYLYYKTVVRERAHINLSSQLIGSKWSWITRDAAPVEQTFPIYTVLWKERSGF